MSTEITRNNIKQETDNKITVIDFWAPWCGPCKIMDPVINQMEKQFADNIHFGKMNVDGNEDIAKQYKVMSMPSIVLFKNGKAVEKVTGIYSAKQMAHYLKRKLAEI
ncbi:thioredoxin [Apilactobacillus micheneri]|uniref:Thioredoxin n=1 Tax=Apilactobacillus micheneri TaxID=1899430 RepID=A0ABY2YWM4_9LACO|nr:thioredoxin [Apilactobacillus micheneri]TPR24524.1 thioredoxin [Apilactobacillus micheneri]TPR25835.1 thioredoxin [Apilactobacillus micheneri]TPR28025.1 thioredoxin [Apilactobacillus micheneri]TPR29516.1 thioredoxin [Apilactobacillus micheneri]TPR30302.1 thioredoxin [Apilactobacillus micheneri]